MALLPPDPVYCFRTGMGHIHSLSFAKKSYNYCSQIVAATETGHVLLLDLESSRILHKQKMGESIQTVHYFDDDIVTREKSGSVKLWTVKNSSYEVKATYECELGFCKSLLLNTNLFVPQENGAVDMLDVNNLVKIKQLVPEKNENLGRMMCLEDVEIGENLYLLGGFETGDVILWDLKTFQPCGHIKLQENLMSLAFDRSTCRGLCVGVTNKIQIFAIDKSFNITLKGELMIQNEGCNVVRCRSDGAVFMTGGWDGRLRVFSWKSLRILVVLAEHQGPITDIQFSPGVVNYYQSKVIAASGVDGKISFWNLYNK